MSVELVDGCTTLGPGGPDTERIVGGRGKAKGAAPVMYEPYDVNMSDDDNGGRFRSRMQADETGRASGEASGAEARRWTSGSDLTRRWR